MKIVEKSENNRNGYVHPVIPQITPLDISATVT